MNTDKLNITEKTTDGDIQAENCTAQSCKAPKFVIGPDAEENLK